MAFMEGKQQLVDLLAAAEFARNKKRQEEDAKRQALQNQLIQQQIEAAKWQNLKDKERPTMTLPAGPGLGGMREKRFLDEQAGYISGVSPTDTFNQWNQNMRQAMASGGGGRGGGGGEDLGNTHSDPYSNYTPNQLAELNAINEYQPQKSKPMGDSASIATELAKLYQPARGQQLGGGSISGNGTYKGFYENPVGTSGKIVDAGGKETVTGMAPAAEYQAGEEGKKEVEDILNKRKETSRFDSAKSLIHKLAGDDTKLVSKARGRIGELLEALNARGMEVNEGNVKKWLDSIQSEI